MCSWPTGARGHALIDRALYLPESWTNDTPRRDEAHVPAAVAFAAKPALAQGMVERAFEACLPAAWVTADEAYGSGSKFRRMLEGRGVGYVLAVVCSRRLFLGGRYGCADEHAEGLPTTAWVVRSCGPGSKGKRLYEWAFVPFAHPTDRGLGRGLLVRRSLADPTDRAYYLTQAPAGATVDDLVRAATSRCRCSPWPSWWPCGGGPTRPGQPGRRPRWEKIGPGLIPLTRSIE